MFQELAIRDRDETHSLHPATEALFMEQEMKSNSDAEPDQPDVSGTHPSSHRLHFSDNNEKVRLAVGWSSDSISFNENEDIFPKIEWCFQDLRVSPSQPKKLNATGRRHKEESKFPRLRESNASYSYQMLRSKSFGSGLCFLVSQSSPSTKNETRHRVKKSSPKATQGTSLRI